MENTAVQDTKSRSIIDIKEVAELIGLNERTVYRLANNRKIPGFKLGGKWVFRRQIITHWLDEQMINNCTSNLNMM